MRYFSLLLSCAGETPQRTVPNSENNIVSITCSTREGVSKEHEYPEEDTNVSDATDDLCSAGERYFIKTPRGEFGR